eukprot:m.149576 g.149576  ORF g.149576 m.149576 type:complete len:860 (+) comp16861_c0_seq1:139-2718(+)
MPGPAHTPPPPAPLPLPLITDSPTATTVVSPVTATSAAASPTAVAVSAATVSLASPRSAAIFTRRAAKTMAAARPPSEADRQTELKAALLGVHEELVRWDTGESKIFLDPVDPRIAPDYYKWIKQPMDLGKIGRNIRENVYKSAWEFMDDVWLMIDNCLFFNRPGSYHNRYAIRLSKIWEPLMSKCIRETLASHNYCCGERRLFSGISYRCRGGTCFIKYGSQYWYYTPEEGEDIFFCQTHYQKLPAEVRVSRYGNGTGDEIKFFKHELLRAKHNTSLVPELFVTCDKCGRKDHEICKLHNSYRGVPYRCDDCRKALNEPPPPAAHFDELRRCNLSDSIEQALAELNCGVNMRVRVINQCKEKCEVKERMLKRFPEYPKELPYMRKVILAATEIDGVSVIFFGIIVHEYGEDCPEPSHRKIYISLLDSVKLPKEFLSSENRTRIYHTALQSYLKDTARRGYRTTHIYTCPPRRGQNYIFPHKPEEQKEISVTRLRAWYAQLLRGCMLGPLRSVLQFRTIKEALPDAKVEEIPYFDGDNWPDILEDIIRLDEKAGEEEKKKSDIRTQIDEMAAKERSSLNGCEPKCCKPMNAGGFFEGIAPPALPDRPGKRRRLSSVSSSAPKPPRMTLDERLRLVIDSSYRDFLVVEMLDPPQDMLPDPDAEVDLASTGEEHSVVSFLKAERLEFSSLRHSKFSSMMLLHLLLSPSKEVAERFPEEKKEDSAALRLEHANAAGMGDDGNNADLQKAKKGGVFFGLGGESPSHSPSMPGSPVTPGSPLLSRSQSQSMLKPSPSALSLVAGATLSSSELATASAVNSRAMSPSQQCKQEDQQDDVFTPAVGTTEASSSRASSPAPATSTLP